MLTLQTSSIYFALIKEQAEESHDYMSGHSSMPLLSLEVKHLQMSQKTQPTGTQVTDITFPVELYYFNQKLSFFEPAIERTLVKLGL